MKLLDRRSLIAAAALLVAAAPAAMAQTPAFPSKPVRIVVPFAPGGTSDILARSIGQKLSEKWGQPVVVENKPGADGIIGVDLAAKSAPDGYTLVLVDISAITMAKSLYAKVPFDPAKDFTPVTMVAFSPHAIAVHPSVPANTIKELIAWSKANPGKINHGFGGGANRLAAAQFKAATGIEMLDVPYKGGAAAITATTGGEVNFLVNGLLATLPHIKGGRIKGLAVSSEKRVAAAPDLPTVIESGVPGFVTGSWQGLLAAAGTPPEIANKIQADVKAALADPELAGRLTAQGADIIANSPADFSKFLAGELTRWAKVAADAGIKPE